MDIFIINKNAFSYLDETILVKFKQKDISNPEKLRTHCLAYYLLDKIFREEYSLTNNILEFINKKPYLKNREKQFSISHSGDYIAIAISNYNCGIDIEIQKDRKNFLDIAKRMEFNSKNLDEFYRDWTLYEAKYKLGENSQSIKQFVYKGYSVSIVSSNNSETFNIKCIE